MLDWLLFAIYGTMTAVLAVNIGVLTRRRPTGGHSFQGHLSILIPARNEAANLRRLLPTLLAQRDVRFEVIVYDDASDDETAAVVTQAGDPRVKLLRGHGPPAGWVGKVHALHQASRAATGDTFLFLDADTVLKDLGALGRMADVYAGLPAHSVLTAVPHFRGGGSLLVSLVPYGLLTLLPLPLAERRGGRRLGALNGQCWMIDRADYLRHEPHLNHPAEILEDVRIGRYLASRGVRPVFVDLRDELEVWMYRGLRSAWRGFRKNAYLLLGGRMLPFAALFGLYLLTYVVAPLRSVGWLAWAVGAKLLADRFSRLPLWVSASAPVTFALWTLLLIDSAWSHKRGLVVWKGRSVGHTGHAGT